MPDRLEIYLEIITALRSCERWVQLSAFNSQRVLLAHGNKAPLSCLLLFYKKSSIVKKMFVFMQEEDELTI